MDTISWNLVVTLKNQRYHPHLKKRGSKALRVVGRMQVTRGKVITGKSGSAWCQRPKTFHQPTAAGIVWSWDGFIGWITVCRMPFRMWNMAPLWNDRPTAVFSTDVLLLYSASVGFTPISWPRTPRSWHIPEPLLIPGLLLFVFNSNTSFPLSGFFLRSSY